MEENEFSQRQETGGGEWVGVGVGVRIGGVAPATVEIIKSTSIDFTLLRLLN